MSVEGILAWLEHGDTLYVRSALINLSEADRNALGPKARSWLTRGNPTRIPCTHAALAVLATAGGSRQAMIVPTHAFGLDPSFVDHAVAILHARAPHWLPDFAEALLDDEGRWNWRLVRGLVRAGAIPAPDHPEYFRGTVRGLPDYLAPKDRRPLIEQIDLDPGLVGDHLFGMLSTEGTGRLPSTTGSRRARTTTYRSRLRIRPVHGEQRSSRSRMRAGWTADGCSTRCLRRH